jgi:hypothetical protein
MAVSIVSVTSKNAHFFCAIALLLRHLCACFEHSACRRHERGRHSFTLSRQSFKG